MATNKKPAASKVVKMKPPKKPTKEEMFKEAILPTFEAMIKADRERLNTATGIESIKVIMDTMFHKPQSDETYILEESLADALAMRDEYINPYIDELEKIINSWDYKLFDDIKEDPFVNHSFYTEKNELSGGKYIACYIQETIKSAYVSRIQECQRQLANCD